MEFGTEAGARPAVVLRAAAGGEDRLARLAAGLGLSAPEPMGRGLFLSFLPQDCDLDLFLPRLAAAVDGCGNGIELVETRLAAQRAAGPLVCGPFRLARPGEADPGPDTVVIRPGIGFGSGAHPSTRVAATLMAEAFRRLSPVTVLDAGCGNGILSLMAARLGAERVLGVECDPEAAAEARENAAANGLSRVVGIRVGDAAGVEERFSLVTANMTPAVLTGILEKLAGMAETAVVLAGFRGRAGDGFAARLAAAGLARQERQEGDGWQGILARR